MKTKKQKTLTIYNSDRYQNKGGKSVTTLVRGVLHIQGSLRICDVADAPPLIGKALHVKLVMGV